MKKLCVFVLGAMMVAIAFMTPTMIAGPPSEIVARASGGGHYLVAASLDVQFAFSAVQYADGSVAEVSVSGFQSSLILATNGTPWLTQYFNFPN